jgi:hypothetical protein
MKEKIIKTDAATTVKTKTQLPTDISTLSNVEQNHLKGGSDEEKRSPILKKKR